MLSAPFFTTPLHHGPAAANAATKTIAAVANQTWTIDAITWSYTEAVTGKLTVVSGGDTVFEIDLIIAVTDGLWGHLPFPAGLSCVAGEAVVITLLSGGGTAVGKLNVTYH